MTRVATRDGVAYDVHDRGRGPVLVLLHGFAGSSRTWEGVAATLGQGRRLLAIDLLGHGGSDGPPAARQDVARQAADIAWLIEGLADGEADVVGYSFGSRVALRLAIDAPPRVRRLVLQSPSAGIGDMGARAARAAADERWAGLLDGGDMVAFHDAWEAQPVFVSRASLPSSVREAIRQEHLGASGRGLAASLRGAGQGVMEPLHGSLHAVRAPTLVLAGGLDPVGRDRAAEVAGLTPGAHLVVLEDVGHAPYLERPDAFLRITNEFLSRRGEP